MGSSSRSSVVRVVSAIVKRSPNKLKGEIYGIGNYSRSSVVRVVSAIVKRINWFYYKKS